MSPTVVLSRSSPFTIRQIVTIQSINKVKEYSKRGIGVEIADFLNII